MSIIIDLNTVCLICLQGEKEMRSVFAVDDQTPQLSIAEKISRCSELHIQNENNKLPDKICVRCLNDLSVAWRFRQNCETANLVFRLIQQEEDEAEAMANLELQQHKIKLPSGLKIKRVQPETKTYLLPVQLNEGEEAGGTDGETSEHTEQQLSVVIDSGGATDDEETVEYEDYFESEEALDDEDSIDQMEEEDAFKPIEVKDCRSEPEVPTNSADAIEKSQSRVSLVNVVTKKEEVQPKGETLLKRGRGRPKKVLQLTSSSPKEKSKEEIGHKTNTTLTTRNKTRADKLNASKTSKMDVQMDKRDASKSNAKAVVTVKSFALINPAPTRKRKVHSPDARPSKICEICGNSYKYQHALNAHMRRHTNDRPFNCEFCDKAFVSGVELRRHMRVHTGHKPYSCQYCDRRFSDFGSRIKHERTHTGERPYLCNTCGKSFAYAHVLSVHLRTHTGEKKFQCTKCGKGFTKKVYLQAHMEQHLRSDETETAQRQDADIVAVKSVTLEEYIPATEYIDEEQDMDKEYETDLEATGENMSEEHLDDPENSDLILNIR